MKSQTTDPSADELRRLDGDAKAAFAVSLLASRTRRDTLRTALKALQETPRLEARPALLTLFDYYGRAGGAHDYGAYVRADLLRALQPIVTTADRDLLAQATRTYEFPPPAFKEETALLRSTALVLLAEVDDKSARFHAARLLVDRHNDPMSGQPALNAAQVLGAFGDLLSLFQYVMDDRHAQPPEVVAECLRGLTRLPEPLVNDVLVRSGSGASPVVQIGLVDLLLRHEHGPLETQWLLDSLKRAPLDVFRYTLFAIVAAGNDALLAHCAAVLRAERDAHRIAAVVDALELVRSQPEVAALLKSPPFAPRKAQNAQGASLL